MAETRRNTVGEKDRARDVVIAGRSFTLRHGDVVRAARGLEAEPITTHFVVVGSRRFPPKQLIGELTGLDRADFTSHQARRTLMRLGFSAGRRPAVSRGFASRQHEVEPLAGQLGEHRGEWVAVKDEHVLHASRSPQELVSWLGRHAQHADSVFRVPEDELTASGLAPL